MGAPWRSWPGRCANGEGECEILSCRLACARVQRMEAGPDAGPGVALPGVRHYNGFVEATDWGSSWAGARGSGRALTSWDSAIRRGRWLALPSRAPPVGNRRLIGETG